MAVNLDVQSPNTHEGAITPRLDNQPRPALESVGKAGAQLEQNLKGHRGSKTQPTHKGKDTKDKHKRVGGPNPQSS